ncbi:MAG: capsid cement protein [Pseudomonadota bacterium]
MNIGFTKTFIAGGAVRARRLVKFDGSGEVVEATAAGDDIIGVSDTPGDVSAGDRVDVIMGTQPEVVAGGPVAAGARVTADAQARAVSAAAGNTVVGFAIESADAAGDIITVQYAPHQV